jgi:hypothetical protein
MIAGNIVWRNLGEDGGLCGEMKPSVGDEDQGAAYILEHAKKLSSDVQNHLRRRGHAGF